MLPFIAMLIDYLENIMILVMITNASEVSSGVIKAASIFTQMKGAFTSISWVVILILFVIWLNKKWRDKNVVLKHTLFCMESTGIYGMALVNFITEKANYCLESPLHIKQSLGLTRGKSDKIDAFQIARFCYLHRDEPVPSRTASKIMLTLRSLINERERLVRTRTIDKTIVKELNYNENRSCIARAKNRINILASPSLVTTDLPSTSASVSWQDCSAT